MKVTSTHRLQLFVLSPAIRLFAASVACAFVAYCPDAQATPPSAYSSATAYAKASAYPYNNVNTDSKSIGPIYDLPITVFYDVERDTEGGESAFASAAASTSLESGGVAAASAICQSTQNAVCENGSTANLVFFVRAKLKPGAQPPMFPIDMPLDIIGRGAGFASGPSASYYAYLTVPNGNPGANTVTSVTGCSGFGCPNPGENNFEIGGVFTIPTTGGYVELAASVGSEAGC